MALQGHLCEVKAQSSAVAMTDEATTTSDNLTYQITDSSKRYIDLETAVVVKDSAIATTERYYINHVLGTINFYETGTRTITVTGAYVGTTTVATGKEFAFNGKTEALNKTQFQDTFKQFQAGLKSGNATLGRWAVTDELFIDALMDGEAKIIEYYVDDTHKFAFYGLVTQTEKESEVGELQEEKLNFEFTNGIGVN